MAQSANVSLIGIHAAFKESWNAKWGNVINRYIYDFEKMRRAGAPIVFSPEWEAYFLESIAPCVESSGESFETNIHSSFDFLCYDYVKNLSRAQGLGIKPVLTPKAKKALEDWLNRGVSKVDFKGCLKYNFATAAAAVRAGLTIPPIPIDGLENVLCSYVEPTDHKSQSDEFNVSHSCPPRNADDVKEFIAGRYGSVMHHLRRVFGVAPSGYA